jgi:hypothetical protein
MKYIKPGTRSTHGTTWLKASLQHSITDIEIFVDVESNNGCISLHFEANGKTVVQRFAIARRSTQVGGGAWFFQCPETKKMVRSLYLAADQQRFRSHHALGLTYRSKGVSAWSDRAN